MIYILSLFAALDAFLCLYNFKGFINSLIRAGREDFGKAIAQLVVSIAALVILFFLFYRINTLNTEISVSTYDSQGIYKITGSDVNLGYVDQISPSELNRICQKNNYTWIPFYDAHASSELPEEYEAETGITYFHRGKEAIDGSLQYSWQEYADGPGIGSSLTLEFNTEKQIKFLALYLGNWREDKNMYDRNYIPTILDLHVNGEFIDTLHFTAVKEVKYIVFEDAVKLKDIDLIVRDAQPGNGENPKDDCCIAEVCAFSKNS